VLTKEIRTLAELLEVHPTHPQQRVLSRAAAVLRGGGVIAYPTDSGYALGCYIDDQRALQTIGRIRDVGKGHNYTLICAAVADIGRYARLDNEAFRWIKPHLPGPYTFILRAGSETPRRAQNARRKTIGVRIPDHPVVAGLLAAVGEPIISSTLILPSDEEPLTDARDISERLSHDVDLVLDCGPCAAEPTTVIDLVSGNPQVLRAGRGDTAPFE
jgi:tRNA threonylcarbamoyl adenosine modification protein (Sua5/YciO/YrdC/YwlC family)